MNRQQFERVEAALTAWETTLRASPRPFPQQGFEISDPGLPAVRANLVELLGEFRGWDLKPSYRVWEHYPGDSSPSYWSVECGIDIVMLDGKQHELRAWLEDLKVGPYTQAS